ncbi:MAG: NAD(P)/FAD-dependent oxidoreductase [Bacteroidetes bacterium]|nr:NAD(P)/FAD-dependent oxidoreductase [Bacteroidota bacterium]
MEHLVIIGNGIAGITIARNVRKQNDMKITVISSESKYFFSRTALMYIYMGHMRFEDTKPYEDWFWKKNRIDLVYTHVDKIDTDNKLLIFNNGKTINYDKLVVATGSHINKFGWPGQDLPGVQGLFTKQDLELLEENTKEIKKAVIIGGGLIGIELAEMLHSRNIHVTFLIRENYYWDNILPKEDSQLICKEILQHGFDLMLKTNLKEILAGNNGRVRAVITDDGDEIECQFVGLTPGVHPNIDVVKDSKIETGRGVLVNEYLETNIPDVYAAGDCVEIKASKEGESNRFEQLWYTGKMHGEALANTISGDRTKYDRGVWFNSAKFLDIEYQTYGFVSNKKREGEKTFLWQDKEMKHSVRIVYREDDKSIVGINVYGIRLRHKVFESWIKEKKTITYVVHNLIEANFDPEFFKKFEPAILEEFKKQNPEMENSSIEEKTFA